MKQVQEIKQIEQTLFMIAELDEELGGALIAIDKRIICHHNLIIDKQSKYC
jgi:hypothetical protein